MPTPPVLPPAADSASLAWRPFLLLWLKIGALGFGGPAGQIALMHRELVEQRGWLDDARFLRALNFCMLLPGPEAQQLATWCGWRLKGTRGGLAAGLLFVLPGALVLALLTGLYLSVGNVAGVRAALFGVQAVVLALVALALSRVAAKALRDRLAWALAIMAFVLLFFFAVPFPLVVLAAGVAGWLFGPRLPAEPVPDRGNWGRSARSALFWAGLWAAPLAGLALWLGPAHGMTTLGLFFAKMATVTFGGAYAAMAWVTQAAVETHGWLNAREMLIGLGLAESTPGPLVLVFQFVGGLAGARIAGPWDAAWVGVLLGMVLVLWVTFVPSFLWIFALAPHLDGLAARPGLARALSGISAAVVGVMANLALWFALHLLFHTVEAEQWGLLRLWRPTGEFDPSAAGIALIAWALLGAAKRPMGVVILLGAGAGWGLYALGVATPI
ncbi:chromate efflux transporter [Sandaracinobacteroides saxicola]|uniref:Chromate efflux transporter n=1 Tax=Sandaracinobacteroides saxicola TaxID=2759707 RepID=A0A7G5ILU5_9SPHN|nr:chromate efflux transporter [Sandaracinobacteroides saxicola]QMW24337.1 chromate efflux transporter [Sandaracinobacteroides saxicola]